MALLVFSSTVWLLLPFADPSITVKLNISIEYFCSLQLHQQPRLFSPSTVRHHPSGWIPPRWRSRVIWRSWSSLPRPSNRDALNWASHRWVYDWIDLLSAIVQWFSDLQFHSSFVYIYWGCNDSWTKAETLVKTSMFELDLSELCWACGADWNRLCKYICLLFPNFVVLIKQRNSPPLFLTTPPPPPKKKRTVDLSIVIALIYKYFLVYVRHCIIDSKGIFLLWVKWIVTLALTITVSLCL